MPNQDTLAVASAKYDLDPATRKKVDAASRSLDDAKHELRRIKQLTKQEIDDVAEKYSRSPSTFLAGVVGGGVGASVGIVAGTLASSTLFLAGPIGLAVGAALGVLTFRGRNHWRIERATHKTKLALELILSQINSLPQNAPRDIRNSLYQQYRELMNEYSKVAINSIDDNKSDIELNLKPTKNSLKLNDKQNHQNITNQPFP
ncbi:hypothetical protein [Archangium violaceum]|uniref:hypothetical protein n=1 Tax=Archangium violaceum TaxID=83451 RepID=UPI0012699006|nr:hypothetical protein [Archangium violaceum]